MNIVIKNVTQRQMERFHLNVTHTLNQFLEDDVKDIYLSFDSDHLPTWFVGVKEKEGS
jgi:hypothetical protein